MWHLPFFRAIAKHRANGKIVLFTRRSTKAKELLVCDPIIQQIHYLPHRSGFACHLREIIDSWHLINTLSPRSVWILDKTSRHAIAAKIARVRERHGFGFGQQKKWLTEPILGEELRQAHQIEKLKAMMIASDIAVPETEPNLQLPDSLKNQIVLRFADLPRPWFTFGISARNQDRCWPYNYFCELIERLTPTGGTFFILGGQDDEIIANQHIIELVEYPHLVNVCLFEMHEAASLISLCDQFVGNDSGPMNIAAAVGIPSVGLFGITSPLTYSKFIHPVCSPAGDRRMAAITPEMVIPVIEKLL